MAFSDRRRVHGVGRWTFPRGPRPRVEETFTSPLVGGGLLHGRRRRQGGLTFVFFEIDVMIKRQRLINLQWTKA